MKTHSESNIARALRELALLDPTSLMRAVEKSLEWTTNIWAQILQPDATYEEIMRSGIELHKEHPAWEIRAGDVRNRIREHRLEAVRKKEKEIQSAVLAGREIKPVPAPAELKQMMQRLKQRKEA